VCGTRRKRTSRFAPHIGLATCVSDALSEDKFLKNQEKQHLGRILIEWFVIKFKVAESDIK
jgi:hypothetical protein